MLVSRLINVNVLLIIVVVASFNVVTCQSTHDSDDLYILIDEVSVFTCRGVKNEIKLSEDDVSIVNSDGDRVHFIKAPGNHTIQFKRIVVTNDFGHLSGEIGITLQVPILEGPAGIRFDLPYTMVPETGLLNQQCDEHSGIVQRDGRQYCRYCDLCGLSDQLENDLNSDGHWFLPEVARGHERKFSPMCDRISANTYQFKRTINLPGRRELEKRVNDKLQGLDGEIQQRLNKRRGRFQVFLNLISARQPAMKRHHWFQNSVDCRCCSTPDGISSPASCAGMLSFLYCNYEDCKSSWAQQCLHNSAHIAACYTIEFNYRMTTAYGDVLQFLTENNHPIVEKPIDVAKITTTTITPVAILNEFPDQSVSERCIAKMPTKLTHLRRYCTIFWNAKLCCSHCTDVC